MGVLAALASEKLAASGAPGRDSRALWQTDLISTVSGGSYAGYFLYSRLIHLMPPQASCRNDVPPAETVGRYGETVRGYFADCIPASLLEQFDCPEEVKEIEARRRGTPPEQVFCPPYANAVRDADTDAGIEKLKRARRYWDQTRPETLHQQFLRCHQDVLDWDSCEFDISSNAEDVDQIRGLGSGAALALVTGVSLPAAWTANFLFDWPVNLSPSRAAYRDGIGMTFGLRPKDARAILGTTEWAVNVDAVSGAKVTDNRLIPDPDRLDFASLKALTCGNSNDPPRWVINATAAPSRHLLGWLSQNDIDFDRHIFRMSGDQQCAGSVGPIPVDHRTLWDQEEADNNLSPLLTAVNASAAFFDSNQQSLGQPWRLFAGVGLEAGNLNWGIDLINMDENHQRRTSKARERLHEAAPFPVYLAEAATADASGHPPVFVRLVDGGSSDNLGAYGPIVEGIKDIIVSDHAQDQNGAMADLCYLRNELLLRRGLHLHVPGLEQWPRGCLNGSSSGDSNAGANAIKLAEKLDSMQKSSETAVTPEFFYPIWAWPYPFLAGCVSGDRDPASCLGDPPTRLWIVKPAFDYPYWLRAQTRCLNEPDPDDPSCTWSTPQQRANRSVAACGANDELPCETSAVLLRRNRYLRDVSAFATPEFPQGSTVQMTFNSSGNVYGAYRELAHHYTRQAIRAIDQVRADPDGKAFGRIVRWQGCHPIKGSAELRDLEFLPAWTDIRLPGWGNRERDAARQGVGKVDVEAWVGEVSGCPPRMSAASSA
ncbi:MAG TPA: hypothetical protein PK503_09065, partial [Azonexus sp.]|nr:hypothetical protein [Azonexus sp.]